MANDNIPELKADPIFEHLVQPMDNIARDALCKKLKSDSTLRLITAWNGYILGDFEKYRFCLAQDLPIQIDDKSFYDYNHAASYLCSK